MKEKNDREYDVREIKMDSRFIHCRKDAFVTLLSYLATIAVVWIAAYGLMPDNTADMTYLLGFPLWFAVGTAICIGYALFAIVWAVRTRKFSLAAKGDDREVES